jgi:anaerobic selenocysteine-containing dehydrogenase
LKPRWRTLRRWTAAICPKGQAGLQPAYDPYRIRKVLKRAGQRGENKWMSIPFEQAIKEIGEGGILFADVPGEETRRVEGLQEIAALRDVAISKAMVADVKATHANAAMWIDPALKNTCFVDPVGGSVSFYAHVRLVPGST